MTNGESKYTIIKVETATGNIVSVEDENGQPAKRVDPEEIEMIYDKAGFTYVTTTCHSHSSPGCVYVWIRGWPFKICTPQ